MKITITTDSFKGSLSATKVTESLRKGILSSKPKTEILTLPISDGGEGTVTTLLSHNDGHLETVQVCSPLFQLINTTYGVLKNNTVVIEVASASGLPLLNKREQNPLNTTTKGTGELIISAFKAGYRDFIIGLGGSATNDCGIGILHAFGYRFYDIENNELSPIGKNLNYIHSITTSNVTYDLSKATFTLAVDVTNPLFGAKGAAYTFAEQKGANPIEIEQLDQGLRNFYEVTTNFTHKRTDPNTAGFGAAGGVAFTLNAFFNAKIVSGIDFIADQINLEEHIKNTDLVITGEGKVDKQSLEGKVISGIIKLTTKYKKPLVIIGGQIDLSQEDLARAGITAAFSISNKPQHLSNAMKEAIVQENLEFLGSQLINIFTLHYNA